MKKMEIDSLPPPPPFQKKKTNTHLQKNETGKGGGRAYMTRPD